MIKSETKVDLQSAFIKMFTRWTGWPSNNYEQFGA